jgi:predicted RNase H-like HicB family nuclease
MNKYKIILYWSKEDDCYVAEIPELPGCIAHGETEFIALQNIKEAQELWIETAIEFNDSIPALQEKQLEYS